MNYKCENCEYASKNHWNVKMHNLSAHSTKKKEANRNIIVIYVIMYFLFSLL